jgi:hypothetical protein
MTPTQILLVAGILAAGVMMANFLTSKKPTGSWLLAAALCAAFTVYTGAAIAAEGPVGFIENQATSLLGVQVWYDLIISLGIAIILILPRARAVSRLRPDRTLTGLSPSAGLPRRSHDEPSAFPPTAARSDCPDRADCLGLRRSVHDPPGDPLSALFR